MTPSIRSLYHLSCCSNDAHDVTVAASFQEQRHQDATTWGGFMLLWFSAVTTLSPNLIITVFTVVFMLLWFSPMMGSYPSLIRSILWWFSCYIRSGYEVLVLMMWWPSSNVARGVVVVILLVVVVATTLIILNLKF